MGDSDVQGVRDQLLELLRLIMDEDCAYVVGGDKQLDEAAWRIARTLEDPPDYISMYL